MVIDPSGDRALYKQLADVLRDLIVRRTYKPGQMLPSETQLMQQYGVGRDTVRSAIAILRSEGLVISKPREGTVVAGGEPMTEYVVPPGARVRGRPATAAEARKLGIPEGQPVMLFVVDPGPRKHQKLLRADQTELVFPSEDGDGPAAVESVDP
ncbi:UNVERIFIED_ORG: GntR family transcriptional regulator [Microbispora rosea subsp. rosea]